MLTPTRKVISVLVSLACISFSLGIAQTSYAQFVSPSFWPFPTKNTAIANGSPLGNTHWWIYSWTNGTKNDPCDINPTDAVGIAGTFFNVPDGAFGDTTTNANDLADYDTNTTTDLLAINIIKSDKCMYWEPGTNHILRWYSTGMQGAPIHAQYSMGSANRFLAFRGFSSWERQPGNTDFLRTSGAGISIPGRFWSPSTGSLSKGVTRVSQLMIAGPADNFAYPNYAVLPNVAVNGDLVQNSPTPSYPSTVGGVPTACRWGNFSLHLSGAPCSSSQSSWSMHVRTTDSAAYANLTDDVSVPVIYVGFVEDYNMGSSYRGIACEEWWFAHNIGPVFIASYLLERIGGDWNQAGIVCRQLLSGTRVGGNDLSRKL